MGFLSHGVERSDLVTGDHIYTWRTAFAYSHHGIYVGGNKVVHFTQDQHLSSSPHSTSQWLTSSFSNIPTIACLDIPDCGFRKQTSGGVVMSCLNCFLGNGLLSRFEYGVSRLSFIAKFRGGTCTTAISDSPDSVTHRAMYLLHNGFGNYDLFANNCEDFALYCKTGYLVRSEKEEAVGGSGQASSVVGAPLAAILCLPLRLLIPSPVVVVTAAAATYSLNRYATDIGVRDDVIKVKVENIALFHGYQQQQQLDGVNQDSDLGDKPPQKRQRLS
ncbi:hypothetical protein ABFS82_06G142900 [Erythranthe guttata]|uniref:LRAT domain-containing protein n=1 Tax=Erythranthe guttata TaxID=4155 RepID=A0A022RSH6_ERYGU|nr:PREDICTED: uncharacterized protein LOC105951218 [Erythranthe guttata]EYU43452.1 hypothetical protein MIMGU_mgv1a011705mg [Erythranthe guttata]|eukprot:XP_012830058.1 PREDICTED: uncharacterized protein LOC105951218 [Erythranthe guttata]